MSDPLVPDEKAVAKLSAVEQRELRELLLGIQAAVDRNPLEAYTPYPKQVQFHEAPTRYRMFVGGNRSGKSTCGAADDLIQALPDELVPAHLRRFKKFGSDKPFRGRVITPDLGHTMDVIVDKFFEMTPREALKGGSWDDAFNTQRRVLRFANDAVIDFMSFEQGKDKFGGVALHRVHYDEEPSGTNSWEIHRDSRNRLIDYGGDMLFTMTPLAQTDWVQDRFWDKRNDDSLLDPIFGIQAAMRDNPYLSEKEVLAALEGLTNEERRVIEFGEFVSFGGLFYDEFHAGMVRPTPSPDAVEEAHWDVVVGIDPGQHTGVVWIGFDGDQGAFVFDEHYPKGALIPEIADEIKRRNTRWGVDPTYVIDPAARIRSGPNQEQFTTEYARNGIFCGEGQNARGPGIMEVKRRFQHGKLVIAEDCRNLIWEISRYRRDPNAPDEWAAIKKNDHLVDALRYGIMARTWALPKLAQKRSNYNQHPFFEPPWKGPPSTDNPPLGIMS